MQITYNYQDQLKLSCNITVITFLIEINEIMEIIYITFTSARFRGSPAQPAAQVIRIRGSPRGSLRVTRGSKALVRKGIRSEN